MIAERFALYARACDAEKIQQEELPASAQLPGFCEACLLIAEIHISRGDSNRAAGALCRISESGEYAEPFYQTYKRRVAAIVDGLLQTERVNSETALRLARLVVSWAPESVYAFYRGSEFSDLYQDLAAASRFAAAPPASRMGFFREHYFEHHMERRNKRDPGAPESDFGFCDTVLQYFSKITELRPAERIPVGAALRARLAKPILSLGASHSADMLMSYAVLRDRPKCELKSDNLFDAFARWYAWKFMPANKVPSACFPPDVLAYFNTVIQDYSGVGVAATRFAYLVREQSQAYQSRYDLENSVDTLLFTLEIVAVLLPSSPQCRPFLGAMIAGGKDECTFADICMAALTSPYCEPATATTFSSVLNACAMHSIRRVWPQRGIVPQDVLLIGHGGQGTGLGRNFQMLIEALSGPDISLTTMTYETAPAEFAEKLREWYHRCRTCPVVIAAVNAHDIPALFVKDCHDVLYDCQVVGFFLWETSQAPRVQHLGIRLVDEIWTPTNYVASVYSPFAPVHVVGKGLFPIEESTQTPPRAGGPIRFLTIFDFHSSIERKNPLAVVLAFQMAFGGGERVELVLKASNVNPQHPGNVSGQWERLCAARAGDDRIRIITDRYTEEQMQQLMRDSSCVVSLHRSEGFGYVLSDAMALGIPVIGTDYSGNIDFCDQETSYPVSYHTIPVISHGAHWESEGTQWAEPDIDSAAAQMQAVYSNYPEALRKAALGRQRILEKYSKEAFAARLRERLAAIVAEPGIDPPLHAVQ
jgi:glycosyltransferase involved in cell wall biosynthesis